MLTPARPDVESRSIVKEPPGYIPPHISQLKTGDGTQLPLVGLAHDMNNALTVIKGNLAMVLADLEGDDQTRESLRDADEALYRAAVLTRRIAEFGLMDVAERCR